MKLLGLHPQVKTAAEWALSWADFYGVPVTVTSGFRSWQDQAVLRRNYEQCLATGRFGRTRDCRYPANRPGDSSHNFGLAWDSSVPDYAQEWWDRVRELAGLESHSTRLQVVEGDIRSQSDLLKAFEALPCIDAVIHFAGLKAVGESVE